MSGGKRRRTLVFGFGSAEDFRYAVQLDRALRVQKVPFELVENAAVGYRHRQKQTTRARRGAATKADDRARDDAALLHRVQAARAAHPHASTRTIAKQLLGRVPPGPDGQRALDAMRKRITRLKQK